MTTYPQSNTAQIRRLLNQALDDPGLDAFCQDYFPVVFDRFSRGMRKDEKITLLLDHCRRHGFTELRQALVPQRKVGDPHYDDLTALAEAIEPLLEGDSRVGEGPGISAAQGQPLQMGRSETCPIEPNVKDFFISYNRADKQWAEWIAWHLEEAGYSTIIQAWDFRPGSNFVLDMQKAATEAQRTLAVLSQNYLDALYTMPEWAAAFSQDPTGEKKILLLVRVGECKMKGILSQIVYIDLIAKNEAEARESLLAGLRAERAKPTTAPRFPDEAKTSDQREKPAFPETPLPSQ
jgi:hypothetical protein